MALTAALTVAGAIWTWIAFKRRGAANGLRALGFTLIPAAAYLTGTLEMFTEIAASVTDWATGLVFNPKVWTGVALAGLAGLLWLVSGFIRDRQLGKAQSGRALSAPGQAALPPRSRSSSSGAPVSEDDAEIEALLKRRGIE